MIFYFRKKSNSLEFDQIVRLGGKNPKITFAGGGGAAKSEIFLFPQKGK